MMIHVNTHQRLDRVVEYSPYDSPAEFVYWLVHSQYEAYRRIHHKSAALHDNL